MQLGELEELQVSKYMIGTVANSKLYVDTDPENFQETWLMG